MGVTADTRRKAYVDKTRFELAALADKGVVMVGNAFSPILLVKGRLGGGDMAGGLFAGKDGVALRAALAALGYAPEEWCGLSTALADGSAVPTPTLREAISTLDPATIVLCDEEGASAIRDCYAPQLAALPSFEEASLLPGVVCQVMGMRLLNLNGFAAALDSMAAKRRAWAWLKQIPPLAEPY